MDGQLAVVLILIGTAGIYLIRGTWKTWLGTGRACGSGCGKCPTPPAVAEPRGNRISLPQV